MNRLLALVCAVCPACAAARLWPRSRLRRLVGLYERFCPFCRAHRALSDEMGGEEGGTKLMDGVVLLFWAVLAAGGAVLALWLSR